MMVLAKGLPFGAQTWIAVGTDAAWSVEAHLLALTADLLAGGNWQRGQGKGQQPKPIERPGDARATQEKRERALAKAETFKARHGDPQPMASLPPSTSDRPRDSRGRFVSRKGE